MIINDNTFKYNITSIHYDILVKLAEIYIKIIILDYEKDIWYNTLSNASVMHINDALLLSKMKCPLDCTSWILLKYFLRPCILQMFHFLN